MPCCNASIAFPEFDRSVDFPLEVKAERLNRERPSGLDLEPDRSLLLEPGGGGKLNGGGGSLRFLPDIGEMTVIAVAGLAYSENGPEEFCIDVIRAGGLRAGFKFDGGRSVWVILALGGGE